MDREISRELVLAALHERGTRAVHVGELAQNLDAKDRRAEIEAVLALLAEDADYFAVRGVARDARERELHAAHEERVRAVRGLPLEALGLASLEPAREAVLAVLDDALDVLADARLRARYARALEA
jgi:hypothetical protein